MMSHSKIFTFSQCFGTHSNNNHHREFVRSRSKTQNTHFHLMMIIIIWNLFLFFVNSKINKQFLRFLLSLLHGWEVFYGKWLNFRLDVVGSRFTAGSYEIVEITLLMISNSHLKRIASEMKFSLVRIFFKGTEVT